MRVRGDGERSWLALDAGGAPIADRVLVRDAVAIAAMCELAEESAGGGDLGELRARLVELRLTDNPEGIEEAELAAAELQEAIAPPPRLASVATSTSSARPRRSSSRPWARSAPRRSRRR